MIFSLNVIYQIQNYHDLVHNLVIMVCLCVCESVHTLVCAAVVAFEFRDFIYKLLMHV